MSIYLWQIVNAHGQLLHIHATTADALSYLLWLKRVTGKPASLVLVERSRQPEQAQNVSKWLESIQLFDPRRN